MTRVALSVVAVALTFAPAAVAAVIMPSAPVTVRVYGAANLPPAVTSRALAAAAATMAAADIDIAWTYCDAPASATRDAGCDRPLASKELALRLVRVAGGRAASARRPLGDALIDRHRGSGALATIYLDRVDWLAAAAGTDTVMLLGRAVAHEITHLLLGSTGHERSGLMRAVWSCDDLRRAERTDWGFSARQRAQLYAAAIKRAAS